MRKSIKNSIIFLYILIIVIMVAGCRQPTTTILPGVEVREYEGEQLSTISAFRENSIKGPQTIDIEDYQLEITGLVTDDREFSYDEILENYALVKGGNDLLNQETRRYFRGVRKSEYGFEALTDNIKETQKILGSEIVIDKASLEDIMYFSNIKGQHA